MAAAVPDQIPVQAPPQVLDQEYVAGTPSPAFLSPIAAQILNLPHPEALTWTQIDLMRLDAVIDSALELIKDLVLAEGGQILPFAAPDDQKDRAQELADFTTRAFNRVSATGHGLNARTSRSISAADLDQSISASSLRIFEA